MRIKKGKKTQGQCLPLGDIEKINTVYLDELERVKTRLSYVRDPELINAFFNVLLNSYNATIDLKTFEREVDYEIKLAKIRERERNIKPWRRCWLWRLIFRPVTNRAQDIIEERAKLEAEIEQTAEEKEIEDKRKNLPADEPSKGKLKRQMRSEAKAKLKETIRQADKADVREAFDEPSNVPSVQFNTISAAPMGDVHTAPAQLQGQLSMEDVQAVPARRPRPPRSCRRA